MFKVRDILLVDMARFFRKSFLVGILAVFALSFSFSLPVARAASTYEEINSSDSTVSQGIIFAGICEGRDKTCDCRDSGNCTLDDALQVFVNISNFILGISGTMVLFAFVYGGFKWLFSRGESKWVEEGKAVMVGAVIGLCIIFGSYVALNFIIAGLTTPAGDEITPTNLETTVNNGMNSGTPSDVFTTE